jgi:hypothetical protein
MGGRFYLPPILRNASPSETIARVIFQNQIYHGDTVGTEGISYVNRESIGS